MPPDDSQLGWQVLWLFALAIPVSCVAWTVTHEEVFREPREYCRRRSSDCSTALGRKFFYLFTCEYCFSHYVTVAFLILTGFKFLLDDWRGYVLSFFAVVWVANIYMSLYARLRVDINSERAEMEQKQREAEVRERQAQKLEQELRENDKSASPASSDAAG
jgi:hypothetical protein